METSLRCLLQQRVWVQFYKRFPQQAQEDKPPVSLGVLPLQPCGAWSVEEMDFLFQIIDNRDAAGLGSPESRELP